MKKNTTLLTVSLIGFLMTGFADCDNPSTPQGVVIKARNAILKHKTSVFLDALSGPLQETYRMAPVRMRLYNQLNGLNLRISDIQTYPSTQIGTDHSVQRSVVQIMGKRPDESDEEQVLLATVDCDIVTLELARASDGLGSASILGPRTGRGLKTEEIDCKIVELK